MKTSTPKGKGKRVLFNTPEHCSPHIHHESIPGNGSMMEKPTRTHSASDSQHIDVNISFQKLNIPCKSI